MAQQLLPTSYSPQYVSLGRVSISKPSIWVTKPTIVSSPSFSTSAPLRYASFCCISSVTSSVESNLPSSAKIFVKGLPHSASEGRLMKVFSEFGEVNLVQLPIDEESGQSLGFAFIWFVKEESAQLAIQEMNGKFFDGRFIYVTIAKPGSSKKLKGTTAYKFSSYEQLSIASFHSQINNSNFI